MPTITQNVLLPALGEAMETLAFMVPDTDPDPEMPPPANGLRATMCFTGPVNGFIEIWADENFARQLVSNILPEDAADAPAADQIVDAFKELLNTTCGLVLPRLATTSADVFDVTIPQATAFPDGAAWNDFVAQPEVLLLCVDGHPLAARLAVG